MIKLTANGKTRIFHKKNMILIGRSKNNDVTLTDTSVSRFHAKITMKGGVPVLEDRGSSNGMFVNGLQTIKKVLKDGDLIRLGNTPINCVVDIAPIVRVLEGDNRGKVFTLEKMITTIGRNDGTQIALTKGARNHHVIHVGGPAPFVNGAELTNAGQAVHDKDILTLNGVDLEYVTYG